MNAATKLSKRVGQPQTKKCVLYSQQLFRKCFCSRFVPIKFALSAHGCLSNICCLLLPVVTPYCYELLSYCLNEHPGFTGLVAPLFSKRRGVPPLQMKGRKTIVGKLENFGKLVFLYDNLPITLMYRGGRQSR